MDVRQIAPVSVRLDGVFVLYVTCTGCISYLCPMSVDPFGKIKGIVRDF